MVSAVDDSLKDVVEELKSRLNELEEKLNTLRSEYEKKAKSVKSEIERIRAGLAGLTGQKGGKGRSRKKRESNGQSGYTTEETTSVLEGILRGSEKPQTDEKLNELVYERAQREGRSRQGLHLRVKQALKDTRFSRVGERWQLSSADK